MRLCFSGSVGVTRAPPENNFFFFNSHDQDFLNFAVTYNHIIMYVLTTQWISDTKTISFQRGSL